MSKLSVNIRSVLGTTQVGILRILRVDGQWPIEISEPMRFSLVMIVMRVNGCQFYVPVIFHTGLDIPDPVS